MRTTVKYLIIAVALMLAGRSTGSAGELVPIPAAGQRITYDAGRPFVISTKANIVGVTVLPRDGGRAVFKIGAVNGTKRQENFGTENIVAVRGDKRLRVLSYEDMVRKAKVKDTWGRVVAGFAADTQAGQPIQPTRTYARGTLTDPYGRKYNYEGYGTQYNPAQTLAQQQAAYDMARQNREQLDAQLSSSLEAHTRILRTTTIPPGELYSGIVYIDGAAKRPLTLYVQFGGESHSFAFNVQ